MKNYSNLIAPKTTGARLIVALVAIIFIASIVTATSYVQQAWNNFQEDKNASAEKTQEGQKEKPGATESNGVAMVPSPGPAAIADLNASPVESLFVDGVNTPQAVNNYAPTRTTGITYGSISGTGTSVTSWRNTTSLDDNLSNNQPIGFTFIYNGGAFQNFRVSTNGFITFNTSSTAVGATVSTPYNYENVGLSSSSASTNFSPNTLAPMWDDLVVPTAGTLNGNIKYLTTGVSPNRILTVEWIGMELFSNAGPDMNFQVKLYEADGHIEYVYGTMTSGTTGSYSYSTGINASTVSASPTAAELLTQQTANTATFNNTPQISLGGANPGAAVPATNTQITFTPPVTTPAAPTSLTFPTVGASFATLNWVDNANNETNYNVLISTDGGVTYQTFGAIFPANTTGITVTGLSASTTYFFRVLATTEAVSSTPLNGSVTTGAPVSGTKTIGAGGDYPTLTLAINDVNAGVGSGGVTFNITASTTFAETTPCITGGSAATPVVFQKSGAGANPIVTPAGSTSTVDYGICIFGGDNITFDGIDVAPAGVSTAVEFGYIIVNGSVTNGAQNNIIKNANITLSRTNTSSVGISQNIANGGGTPTATTGANSGNKYYNITVQNSYVGITLSGTASFPDTGCEVGVTGGGTTTIGAATANDIGNGTVATWGIRATNQSGVKIFNVEVRNVTSTGTNAVDGISMDNTANSSTVSAGTCEIFNNKVHDIKSTSASSTSHILSGIKVNLTTNAASVSRVYNNFIYGLDNNSTATSRQIIGIRVQDGGTGSGATHNIDLNSVRLAPTGVSCSNTTFEIGSTSGPVIKVRDNIFANFTGAQAGSAKHYTWVTPSATLIGPAGSVSNNNDLYVNNTTNGFIALNTSTPTDYATLTAWKAFAASPDANSISSDPLFFAATDLHIPSGSPAVDAGSFFAGAITWAGTDIDAQVRPNGATNPDIGADEFYPSPGSVQFSSPTYSITETGVTATITATRTGGSNGAASVNYATSNGTATGGASCGAGVDYITTSGTLNWADLDSASKTFTVTVCNDGVSEPSETVNLALTGAVTASLGTPNTAVLTITNAADVFNGTVNVGTGQTYTSLTNTGGLFENINNGSVTGNTTINITSDLTGETGTVALNQFAGGFTLTIKPSGAARTISGSATSALIKLNGADNVTIDGSTSGGTDRSLTITNTNTAATIATIWLSSLGTGLGATNDTVKNVLIAAGTNQATGTNLSFGIFSGGTTLSITSDGVDNDTNTFNNNFVISARYGIYLRGGVANSNDNNVISQNLVGPAAFGATEIGRDGIVIQYQNTANVTQNEVRFVGGDFANRSTFGKAIGIAIGSELGPTPTTTIVTNSTITRNLIHDIVDEKTGSAIGIEVGEDATAASGNTVANNMIYNVHSNGTSGDQTNGLSIGGGNGDKIVFNSISLTGDLDPGSSSTSSESAAGVRIVSTTPVNLTLKDNIISVDVTSNTSTLKHYAFVIPSSTYAYGTGGADYNDYFVNASNTQMVLFGIGTAVPYTDKAALPSETGQDANSISLNPSFVSATNLHVTTSPVSPVNHAGTSIAGITTDFDGDTRNSTPDIGADEIIVPGSLQLSSATYSVNEGAGNIVINVTRTGGSDGAASVHYATADGTAGSADYTAQTGTLNWTDGDAANKTITVPINDDSIFEGDETFSVSLDTATGATLGSPSTATVTINDNDSAPAFSIDDVTHNEGDSGTTSYTFTVTKTGATAFNSTVDYATVNGTATAPSDFTAIPATTLTFLPGDATKQVTVLVNGDTTVEPNEAFTVHLSNATGASIADADGTGAITNDDTRPPASVVYVDDDFTGAPGTDPDGAGPATEIGYDAFPTIQGGATNVASGGTVNVAAGTYTENVTIAKPLTLTGAGQASVTLRPAISNPNCGGAGGGSLCAGSSNLILVQASNVTISGLTLDGDNPSLTSGTVRSGADIDARNGIITNHTLGTFNNLSVHDTTVRNIYLRGMYASSGGDFNFTNNTVSNVTGDGGSIAIFSFSGAGTYSGNIVSDANDGISANHSRGIQFLNNQVSDAASGIHTDNAGDGGGVSDLIQGNTVANSKLNGYGIWTFVPFLPITVNNNTVTNVDVGLSAAGGQSTPVATTFTNNTVNGMGKANATGVYLTTDQFGFGLGNNSVVFRSNTITGNVDGFYLETTSNFSARQSANSRPLPAAVNTRESGGKETTTQGADSPTAQGTLTLIADFNRITGNSSTGVTKVGSGVLQATMENNWWGCNAGPGQTGCQTVDAAVDFNPWLVLTTSASPNPIAPGGASTVTADMTHNSDGAVPSATIFVPATPVSFSATNGNVSPTSGTITNGQATTTFTSTSANNGTASATVDNQTTPTNINVTAPTFSIDDVTHNEGDSGTTSYTFTVTKTGATAFNATVDYATVDGTATDADNDYEPLSLATLTFLPADTAKQVTVTVNGDTTFEADETFTVHLSNATGATIADADGTGTITNDDTQNTGTFQFSAASYSVNESRASATITVTRTVSTSGAATIHYATSDGTATAGADYTTASGDLSFANGDTSKTFTVAIINDTDTEPSETVTLTLSAPSAGATLGTPNPATLTITDNDGAASSNVVVVLPTDLHGWSAFNEQTASATFTSGPATPPYGSGSYQMSTGAGDGAGQGGKSYFKTNTYNGTRLDAISSMSYSTYVDPSTPGNNIAPVIEMMVDTDGNGTRNTTLVFEPIYSPEQGAIQKGVWQTWNARAGKWRSSATVGPIVPNTYFPLDTFIDAFPGATIVEWFPRADGYGLGTSVGQSSGGAWANFVGSVDGFEIGANNASTINDYELALPAISVDDPTFVEGDSVIGPHFTVTLNGKSSVPVMVDYATADGTATAGSDYQSTSGTLTFAPNETSKDVLITVVGDMANEGTENFFLNLTNPVNATISDAQGIGTITDNDAAPSFSIDDVTHMEGNSGTTVYTFTVTKTGATTFATSVDFTTVDGTATVANNDYASNNGTLNFAAGDTTKQITVNVNGDYFVEPDEAFTVHLSNESGATIADADGTGTIQNDDSAPAVVYVDDDFTGAPGTDPDGAGPATAIGYDAFPTIQGGVNGVAPGGTVNVAAGAYHEDVNVNKTVNLNGAGAGVVTISGPIGGPATALQINASNVSISGFTITRDGNNTTDWNNPGLNNAGIAIQGLSISGALVHDNIITGNRTGIDINNSNGHTIRNNVIDFNRTGLIFRNQTDSMTVVENFITNNWTVGILFLDGSGGSNVPVQSAAHSSFTNNNISANWYGQIVDRQAGGSIPAPGTSNVKNFRGNWFGTTSPVVTTANSAEPGYAAQIPVAYGGTATPPGGQPDIAGPASANLKYIPFLLSGTDTNVETTPGRGTFGFQGVSNTVVVWPVNMNGWTFFDDNPGTGTGSGGFEDGPATPPLGVGSAFLTVDATGRHALGTATYAGTRMDDIADLRYSSYQDNNSNTVVAPSLQFDIDYDLADTFTGYQGRLVFEPYQSGTVQQNVWQNWNALAGNWYGTRSTVTINGNASVPNPCQQNSPCTWQQVLASFPNAGVLNNSGAMLFKVGGPWSPGFDGNVDAFNISVNAAHVVYDFEPLPHLSIDDVTHLEGNSGTTAYTFTVTLSRAIDQTVTVDYATQDVTASAPSDYTALSTTQLIFNPGDTVKQVVVQVNGDTGVEPDETFNVKLSNPSNATITDDTGVGTIQNDDTAAMGILAFSSATYSVNENDPAHHATITVTRSGGTNGTVSVDYATTNGTATAGSDYTTASGTLVFNDGVSSQTFDVPIIDDNVYEGNETVNLALSNPQGGTSSLGSPSTAVLTIGDNEAPPAVSINDVTVAEGNSGTTALNFNVTLSRPSAFSVTVNYQTANGTAKTPGDYQTASGVVTFPANSTSQPVAVTAFGDTVIEGNETLRVNLSSPTGGATLGDAQGVGTLDNDDGATGRLAFTKNDFDGDAHTDIAIWRGSTGNWYINNSGGAPSSVQFNWGESSLGDVAVPADYDGDGKTDIAVWRATDGNWYIVQSSTGTPIIKNWGEAGDLPVPGDYDGDNKTDVAVWRQADGNWYILNSRDNTSTVHGWGTTGDQPVLGDFDGDRMTDIAVYRPSEGNWYIVNSSLNNVTLLNWGAGGDRPAPADFDGDGKTDITVFRAAGNWYIRNSGDNTVTLRNWGNVSDELVPGNYDNDAKADIAVWRPNEGTWYIINSASNTGSNFYLGLTGDTPVPAAYLH
ncbi:MAG: trimeric autotransporter adhesin [Blastocatellia bacterium]|jgi:hypothetical protein|nr:trimeric autotransporter adhesin [Blastocatellia bacterium]